MRRSPWLVIPLLVAACHNAQKACDESQANRAAGLYAGQAPDAAATTSYRYGGDCYDVCIKTIHDSATLALAQDTPACVEADLLTADRDPVAGTAAVIEHCRDGRGPAPACAWVQDHPAQVAAYLAGADQATTTVTPAAPDTDLPTFVSQLEDALRAHGWTIVSDETYSFDSGYIPFALPVQPGLAYTVALVAPASTTFTARFRGFGIDDMSFFASKDPVPSNLFVRYLKFQVDEALDNDPQVVVADDGGDQGQVRVVVASTPR